MTDTTTFHSKLEAELTQIVSDLESIAVYNEETGDWEAVPDPEELRESDENSEADGVEEWNERRATVASLEVTFRNIKRAQEKISADTFGLCEICLAAIEPERLDFLPTARTCATHRDEERTLPL